LVSYPQHHTYAAAYLRPEFAEDFLAGSDNDSTGYSNELPEKLREFVKASSKL
jgi:hypothetical protein